jgi:hypothetical protein
MANRAVIVAGATGLVGKAILEGLLADRTVTAVHGLGRRKPVAQHPKLTAHVVDFAALPALPPADEVYLALGTTIKVAGSQAAFRAVDYDANLAVMPFEGLVIARPSMLVGNREDLGQPVRQGEVLASALGKAVGFLIPANYKPIDASAVANALLLNVPSARGRTVLLSGSMRREALPST